MLVEIGETLVSHLSAQLGSTKSLRRIKAVVQGDTPLRADQLPGITVDWDDRLEYSDTGNHLTLEPVFAVTLYTSSMQGEKAADILHQQCLIEHVSGGFLGLIPTLLRMRGGFRSDNGTKWSLSHRLMPRTAFRDGGGVSTVQTVEVTFTTLLDPHQI